jgi:hypothetical protein
LTVPVVAQGAEAGSSTNTSVHESPAPKDWANWTSMVNQNHPSGQGCFEATYPSYTWHEVKCDLPPNGHQGPPSKSNQSQTVGGLCACDYTAKLTASGTAITQADTFVTSETGFSSEYDGSIPNKYSWQINTNWFSTSVDGIAGSGLVQFIFQEAGCWPFCSNGVVFVEYWLLPNTYGDCPANWGTVTSSDGLIYCYKNSNSVGTGFEKPQYLLDYGFYAATEAPNLWTEFCDSNQQTCWATAPGDIDSLGYNNNWVKVEANVFGYSGGSQASFNSGVSLSWRVLAQNSVSNDVGSITWSYTLETNNLNLGPSPTFNGHNMYFTESN